MSQNPPAFPVHPGTWMPGAEELPEGERAALWAGMTPRDWFAGQALLVAFQTARETTTAEAAAPFTAFIAYQIADAMLAERERQS